MEQRKHLEDLNKQALEKFDAYMKTKAEAGVEHHEKINSAKEKWQAAWAEFLETLVVLERLEI
jgi:hypothetical protein